MARKEYSPLEQELFTFLSKRFDGVADVELTELTEENTLYIGLSGSCADCPMRELSCSEDMTSAVREAFPQIDCVSTRPHVNEDLLDFARNILQSSKN